VVREVLVATALGLAVIALVLVGRNLVERLDEILAGSPSAVDWLVVSACIGAMLLSYALPIGFLFGVVFGTARLAADREVLALRACGVGLRAVVRPVAALGVCVALVSGGLVTEVEHRAQRRLRAQLKEIATHGTMILPGSFRRFGERVLWVRDRDAGGDLEGVLISDRAVPGRPLLILAERGRVELDARRREVRFALRDGDIHFDGPAEAGGYRRIGFRTFDYRLAADALFAVDRRRLRPREMPLGELRALAARAEAGDPLEEYRKQAPVEYHLEIQRRLALPCAPFLFALVGAPLGLRLRRSARGRAALLCAAVVGCYYALLVFGQYLARAGWLDAAPALWAPNAVFAALAAVLWAQTRRSDW
jgi:lipopolysaccharide export system permease protein